MEAIAWIENGIGIICIWMMMRFPQEQIKFLCS